MAKQNKEADMEKTAMSVVGSLQDVDIWMNPKGGPSIKGVRREHEPPHVHTGIYKQEEYIEFIIENQEPLYIHKEMKRKKRKAVEKWIKDHKTDLLEMWRTQKIRNLDREGKRIGSRLYALPWQVVDAWFDEDVYTIEFADGTAVWVPADDMEEITYGLTEAIACGDARHGIFDVAGGGSQLEFADNVEASGQYIWYVCGKNGNWSNTEDYGAWYARVMFDWSNSY